MGQISDQKIADSQFVPELAIRRCVLGKDSSRLFPIGVKHSRSLPVVVAQPHKRLADRTQKRVLYVGAVRPMQSAWFIRNLRIKEARMQNPIKSTLRISHVANYLNLKKSLVRIVILKNVNYGTS